MTSAEIRQSFLDFFQSKQHEIVSSASLMPTSPNLLFTNAGMNQFVPYFLGERLAPYKRAADTQKCIRAGGKHNDLEDVGFDTYHQTLFEMLGNWSFGDYFKKEAIEWAWELLTGVWKMPKERLYATVYKPGEGDPADFDQEAYDFWKAIFEKEGLDPAKHIVYGNKKDNFWMMGETGPCGPCSEVHIDLTPAGDTEGKLVNEDSPYCIEIWNLVFIQFNAEPNGDFKPLAAQHVDTGMGFERVAGIMATTQGFTDFSKAPSNYNSDLFTYLFDKISEMSGHTYQATLPENRDNMSELEMNDCTFRVLGDHIRTLSFSIADGILPGNAGRNYVLRRILRRAVLFGKKLNLPSGFFAQLVDPLVEKMSPFFPELKAQRDLIFKIIQSEENAFEKTLDRGLRLFDKIAAATTDTIRGEDAFELYDTYGFPSDLTELIARERGLTVDMAGFETAMQQQRKRAQESQVKEVISVSEGDSNIDSTEFVGFELENTTDFTAQLVSYLPGEKEDFLIFEKSPFYAEMGGQVGDSGTATFGSESIRILDTQKNTDGLFLHKVVKNETLANHVGQQATLSVGSHRRAAIQRHHSATHMLNYALREVLGTHVLQAGSLVNEDYLRFDFSHFEAMTAEQIAAAEKIVNQKIIENSAVQWYEVPFDEKPEDCIATFGEKYGAQVRVVDIGGYSKELCGGTHVRATGEIGLLKITSESAVAAGTRRIEAVVGESAVALATENFGQLQSLAQKLSCKPQEIETRLQQLLDQRSELEKKLQGFERKGAAKKADELASTAQEKNGQQCVVATVEVSNPNDLRGLAVQISKTLKEGVVILGATFGPKATVVALATPEAVAAGFHAGNIIKEITAQLDGKGGGKPDFAMGGGSNTAQLDPVLKAYLAG